MAARVRGWSLAEASFESRKSSSLSRSGRSFEGSGKDSTRPFPDVIKRVALSVRRCYRYRASAWRRCRCGCRKPGRQIPRRHRSRRGRNRRKRIPHPACRSHSRSGEVLAALGADEVAAFGELALGRLMGATEMMDEGLFPQMGRTAARTLLAHINVRRVALSANVKAIEERLFEQPTTL